MIGEPSGGRYVDSEPDDSRDPVQRPEVLPCNGEHVQSGGISCPSALFGVQLLSGAAQEFGFMAYRGERSGKEQEIARLDRRHVRPERRRRRRQFNARGRKSGLCVAYHFPLCAPASTCSTSPVT